MTPYQWGEPLSPTLQVERAVWYGWWPRAGAAWWSEIPVTGVIVPVSGVDSRRQYILELQASAPDPRRVQVTVNGRHVGDAVLGPSPQRETFVFDGSVLDMHNTVRVTLIVPDLYNTPPLVAYIRSFSYFPHELGIKNVVVQLATLPKN